MKRLVCIISLTLFFLTSFFNPQAASSYGPSASGTFQILVDEGPTRNIEFIASLAADGTTTGVVTVQDTTPVPQTEGANGTDDLNSAGHPFSLKAEFDCLTIDGNKAVMSGTVTESSLDRYIGRRLLLVAQDGNTAANPSGRDRLTWGVYRTTKRDWFPTDSERLAEPETSIAWIAKDAERPEDEGMLSNKSEEIGCRTFPFSSFSFFDAKHAHGDIQVHP